MQSRADELQGLLRSLGIQIYIRIAGDRVVARGVQAHFYREWTVVMEGPGVTPLDAIECVIRRLADAPCAPPARLSCYGPN